MEEWKEIPGLSSRYGKYYASSEGRAKNGQGKIMLLRPHYKGYRLIRVIKNGKSANFQVHRAVALAFIPNPENKPQVNHKNGIKTDNRLENLEWCTNFENYKHAERTGLRKNVMPKQGSVPDDAVREIRAAIINKNGRGLVTRITLAKKYGISGYVVEDIRGRRSYAHIK